MHEKMLSYSRALNFFYLKYDALWADDTDWRGFQWVQPDDGDNSILAFRRINRTGRELLCVLNFTPVLREDYRLGVPKAGTYVPVFCSDEEKFGGTGQLPGKTDSEEVSFREYDLSALFRVPPMSLTFYEWRKPAPVPVSDSQELT